VVAVHHDKAEPPAAGAEGSRSGAAQPQINPSLPDGVVDLAAYRWRPWPGWWGRWHLATWTAAERSRRPA
jgi:hypothetical protein